MISSSTARASRRGVRRLSVSRRSSTARPLRGVGGLVVVSPLRSAILRQRFYSTERILQLRTGKGKEEQPRTVYDPKNEKENCGVGLIASLKSVPSREIVEKADEMLVRMAHRGGCGCDPASGDGSGT